MSAKPANLSNQPLAPTRVRSRVISYRSSKDDSYRPSTRTRRNERSRNYIEKWENAAASNFINGSWTREEDETIVDWVKEHGPTSWTKLAELLPGRIGKQCRERWHNSLNPSVIKSQWTQEEDELICKYQAKLGNKWARISEMLPGRTDNAVKNRWNSTLKKKAAQILANMQPSASSSDNTSEEEENEVEESQSSPVPIQNASEHATSDHNEEENAHEANDEEVHETTTIDIPRITIPTSPAEKNNTFQLLSPVSPPVSVKSPFFLEKDSPKLLPPTPTIDWTDPWNDSLDFISRKSTSTFFDVDQLLCPDL